MLECGNCYVNLLITIYVWKRTESHISQWKKWCNKVTTWWFWTEVKNNLAVVHEFIWIFPAFLLEQYTKQKVDGRLVWAQNNLFSSSRLKSQGHNHCPCIFHWPWGSSCRTRMRQSHFPREYLIWLIVLDRTSVELLCCQIKFGQCAKHYSLLCKSQCIFWNGTFSAFDFLL